MGADSGVTAQMNRSTSKSVIQAELKVDPTGPVFHVQATRFLALQSYLRATARVSLTGAEVETSVSKRLGHLAKVSGAFAVGTTGITLRLRYQRFGQTFILPIQFLSTPEWLWGAAALSLPLAIAGALQWWFKPKEAVRRRAKEKARREKHRATIAADRERAMQDVLLAESEYQRKLAREQEKQGLVITRARYGDLSATLAEQEDPEFPCVIDVTKAVMVLVHDSTLRLESGSKKSLPGFYDPCSWVRDKQLSIEYTLAGEKGDVVLADNDELSIPEERRQQ
eukprot:TRINITY_DN2923_c0_g1_i2.p1 TRINITY_DN2923_c0_g1~~TRINITY_DN2923_c0_g1_i2.p1  ORF type:complete len:282 (-),score=71.71 TRINITY_DN2923_c0_g1_i2:8-853(-)